MISNSRGGGWLRPTLAGPVLLALTGPVLVFPFLVPMAWRVSVVAGLAFLAGGAGVAWLRPFAALRVATGALWLCAGLAFVLHPRTSEAVSHWASLGLGIATMAVVARWAGQGQRRLYGALAAAVGLGLALSVSALATVQFPANRFLSAAERGPVEAVVARPRTAPLPPLNSTAMAGVTLTILPLAVAAVIGVRGRGSVWLIRGLGLATAVGGSVILVFAQSRGGWLGAAVIGAIVLLRSRRRWAWGLVAVVIVATGVVIWTASGEARERVRDGGWTKVDERVEIFRQAGHYVLRSPWIGIGINEFRHLYRTPDFTVQYDIANAHNIVLQTALDIGIPGLLAYLVTFGWIIHAGLRRNAGLPDVERRLAAGGALCVAGGLLFGLGDAITLGAKLGVFQWIAAGVVLGAVSPGPAADAPVSEHVA